jgi:phage terminase large subunit
MRNIKVPDIFEGLIFPKARYRVFYGGRGGGRSWAAARTLLVLGVNNKIRVLCAREFQKSISDSVHRLLSDQIDLMGLSAGYEVKRNEIVSQTGSIFLFEGLRHNVNKIKSMEGIDIAWVEEAEHASDASWEILIPTIRKEGSEIWITFNPDQETDPTYKRFVLNPPPGSVVQKTSWRDNPWFPEELKREKDYLWRVDPERASHVWDGECRTHSDAQVLKGKWTVDVFDPGDDWDGPYFGADFGFAVDPTTLVKFWIYESKLYIEHEVYGVGVDLDDTPAMFDRIPGSRDYIIRADCSRPETISHLKRRGFKITGAPKWAGSVEDGVAWLRSCEQIVIHDRCKHTIEEARNWSYKTDRLTGDVLPQLRDGFEHCWDGVRYGASPLIRQPGDIFIA